MQGQQRNRTGKEWKDDFELWMEGLKSARNLHSTTIANKRNPTKTQTSIFFILFPLLYILVS